MDDHPDMPARRGRAARTNPPNRFEPLHVVEDPSALDEEELRQVPTQFFADASRSILAKNDSPDVPFTYSLNPYRGCEHGCVYCLSGDTPILMADGRTKPLCGVQVGDEIYGTERRGWYRRYVKTQVLAHWSSRKPAYRISLADGTHLVASADHRFLTDRGWKFVTGAQQGSLRRPHLTMNNKLMGVGAFAGPVRCSPKYRRGYLCGMIRGDGHLGFYEYERPGRRHGNQWHFRLALKDEEALRRTSTYLSEEGIQTHSSVFGCDGADDLPAIRSHARSHVEAIEQVIAWPTVPSDDWSRGFLAGIFDAEGSYSSGIIRIANTDGNILRRIETSLAQLSFHFVYDVPSGRNRSVQCIRLRGGLHEHLRFFHTVDSAILRKRDIAGQALKSDADLRICAIEPLGVEMRMYDITTGTGDFIANGVVSHNCYARPSHEYLGFSAGLDFETKILVKKDAPRLLSEAFQQSSWEPQVVALSGNTDCYQPAERTFEITRRCLEVFLKHRNPVTIITKNGLITRDLDVLKELAVLDLVRVTVSVTSLRPEVTAAMEPRTARPPLRLKTIRRLADAGVPVGVLVAPVVPGLTDEEVPGILEAAAEHGATRAGYTVLRLPGAVEELFIDWLERSFPDRKNKVLNRLRELRSGNLSDARFGVRMSGEGEWARLLRELFAITCRKLDLNGAAPPLSTEHFRRLPGGQLGLF